MPGQKILYFLIGPKGAGKTYIGMLVNQHTEIAFLRVEPIWLSLQPGEDGWEKVEAAIDRMFQSRPRVMVESLGAGTEFRKFKASLAKKYILKMIRVVADLDTCLNRVKSRNKIDHIPVSDEKVNEYNRAAAKVTFDWDLEINNNGPAADVDILAAIRSIG